MIRARIFFSLLDQLGEDPEGLFQIEINDIPTFDTSSFLITHHLNSVALEMPCCRVKVVHLVGDVKKALPVILKELLDRAIQTDG